MRTTVLVVALSLLAMGPVSAAHYHLNADGTGDYPTIQAAITAASSGDTIACDNGTYSGTGNDAIDFNGKNLILKSESNQPRNCIIDCSFDRGFYFHSGETSASIVQGFTIDGGSETNGAGIYIQNASPIIFNCVIQNCQASSSGGGIYVNGASASPRILDCLIVHNEALGVGGGIRFYYSMGEARNCTLAYNTGDNGGGISFQGADADVVNCIIWGNSPVQLGGASYGLFDYNLVAGWTGGGYNFDGNPYFVTGSGGGYYLDQALSDAVDAGSDPASDICYTTADGSACMSAGWTTKTNQQAETGLVDVGYHYPHYAANIDVPSYIATIQGAIDAAWNGDVVRIADGTYRGDGNRDLDLKAKRITVRSLSGNASACIIDCQGGSGSPHRGFYIRRGEGAQSIVEKIKIINGWVSSSGGGIFILNSAPTIRDCILSGNYCGDSGGGMMIQYSNATVTGCSFLNNNSNNAGGGVLCHTCSPSITNCTFESNWALWGGGGLYDYMASPTVTSCIFRYNLSNNWGGGTHDAGSSSRPYYTSCLFQENNALDGGGLYCRQGAVPTILSTQFVANEAGQYGAGIYCNASSPEMDSCLLYGNSTSTDGGGMYCTNYCSALVENTVFLSNRAENTAGGFYSRDHDNATLSNCTFFRNDARSGGGGMYVYYYSTPDIARCIFWEDTASYGAQIGLDLNSTITVSCCDIQGGQAGIFRTGGSTISWGTGNIAADPLFCDPNHNDLTLDSESPCAPAHSGGCGLIGAMDVGCSQTGVENQDGVPTVDRLHGCYPNPSTPETRIAFDLTERRFVSLRIYDVQGRLVRTLAAATVPSGRHQVSWDGRDGSGREAANGVYLCRMTAGAFHDSRRIVLLR